MDSTSFDNLHIISSGLLSSFMLAHKLFEMEFFAIYFVVVMEDKFISISMVYVCFQAVKVFSFLFFWGR
jgi:hypothetical protein